MKILVVSQHYYPENFRITDICETLVNMGHEVSVICGYPNYPEGKLYDGYRGKDKKKHKEEIINGVRVYRCYEIPRGHSSVKLFFNYYSVCLSMKHKAKRIKGDFDCVFVNQTSPVMVGWAGIAYAKKHHVPCILYCYDLWPASLAAGGIRKQSLVYKIFNKISQRVYKKVDHICVTSKSFIEYLVNNHGISCERMTYLPQYCEDIYTNIDSKKHDGLNFVFAGNIGKMQSVDTIVRAADLIRERTDIRIHIVGDGSSYDSCRKLASDLNLNNIIFYGRKPIQDMPFFFSIADAMIVTLAEDELISKTLPGKVQSYMAAGKPIIACANGETNKIIFESKCGYCCSANDYIELAFLFCGFSKKDFPAMANAAKSFYYNNFSKNAFFERLNLVFEKMKDNQ